MYCHTVTTSTTCISLYVVHTVKECDRLSLVTYDTQVYLDFGLTAMDKLSKERTKALVSKLEPGSSTNLCGGLVKGIGMSAALIWFCRCFLHIMSTLYSVIQYVCRGYAQGVPLFIPP